MDAQKIGRYIAACRKNKGYTQKELADKLGITNKAVSKWETGQGMPDISVLLELSEILDVPVDSLLTGEEHKADYTEKGQRQGVWDRIRTYFRRVHLDKRDIAGMICVFAALMLLLMQGWYLLRGRAYQAEYIAAWMFYGVNAAVLIFLYAGGICIRKFQKYFKKKWSVAALLLILAVNVLAGVLFMPPEKEIISVSKDLHSVMVLKVNKDNGKAVLYRNRRLCFVRPSDVFPYTVKGKVKVQWLTGDVCALTYKAEEDDGVHQYVATYGDRGDALSYYYVTTAMLGTWNAEGKHTDYQVELTDGRDGGIRLRTPMGEETYNYDECLQYGTLAIVFPKDNPRWTLVLNQDCELDEVSDIVKDGGSITLCKISMDKTAPVKLY